MSGVSGSKSPAGFVADLRCLLLDQDLFCNKRSSSKLSSPLLLDSSWPLFLPILVVCLSSVLVLCVVSQIPLVSISFRLKFSFFRCSTCTITLKTHELHSIWGDNYEWDNIFHLIDCNFLNRKKNASSLAAPSTSKILPLS